MQNDTRFILWQRIVWYSLLVGLVIWLLVSWPNIYSGAKFIFDSPAYPLWKSATYSRPYAIGILNAVFYTLMRVVTGTALGFAVGTLSGLTLSYLTYLGPRLYRLLLLLAPVAPLVWLPFALGTFGISELTTILIVASGSVFVSGIVVYYLAANTKRAYLDIAVVFGASKWQCLRFVVVPAMIPMLLLLLRLNLFASWMAVLAAEMVGVDQGLGSMLIMGRSLGNLPVIVFAAVIIATVAITLDRLLSFLAFRLIHRRYGALVQAKG